MESQHLFEEQDPTMADHLKAAFDFWEKRRLLFNLLVGACGLPGLFIHHSFGWFDLIGIALWALVANGLYSLGYVFESNLVVRTNGKVQAVKLRSLFFWVGLLGYMGVTLLSSLAYAMLPFD